MPIDGRIGGWSSALGMGWAPSLRMLKKAIDIPGKKQLKNYVHGVSWASVPY